jgi:hypothetical protein
VQLQKALPLLFFVRSRSFSLLSLVEHLVTSFLCRLWSLECVHVRTSGSLFTFVEQPESVHLFHLFPLLLSSLLAFARRRMPLGYFASFQCDRRLDSFCPLTSVKLHRRGLFELHSNLTCQITFVIIRSTFHLSLNHSFPVEQIFLQTLLMTLIRGSCISSDRRTSLGLLSCSSSAVALH